MKTTNIILSAVTVVGLTLSGCTNSPVSVDRNVNPENDKVSAVQPDLVITSLTYLSNTSGSLKYRIVIKNQGTANIANIKDIALQNILSENTTIGDADDKTAGGSALGVARGLNAGESFEFEYYMLDMHWSSSKKYLIAIIDYSKSIVESNENNNNFIKTMLSDLIITSMSITSKTASKIEYSITIKNDGFTSISDIYNVTIQNFLSGDATYGNTDDVAAGGKFILVHKALNSKASYTFNYYTLSAQIPNKKYLIPVIDYSNIILEVKEGNNTKSVAY